MSQDFRPPVFFMIRTQAPDKQAKIFSNPFLHKAQDGMETQHLDYNVDLAIKISIKTQDSGNTDQEDLVKKEQELKKAL